MQQLVSDIGRQAVAENVMIATAESCTGGWIAQEITAVAGSSAWFDRGFVTYSNQSKHEMLGVAEQTLEQYGAVSEPVVIEMAEGVLLHSSAQLSVVTSGVAGPGGGSAEKPVGTVWFAWAVRDKPTRTAVFQFNGDRESVRKQAVRVALEGILQNLTL
ncbi:nicotinamide-nucleotide amidase [Neptuniibacter pectenicola]|jgi:nicotinamide-nucleotide amidase|uniref:Nicotinamide-nucleotide amidase n=1 Tax=Neptuniibacter pectenicola TaxID=1806669 RepID=A0ABU9TQB7_9GAMM|nr:nicotinamide-nucleotide amidase [Neptuniibacter pectenicola]KXJ50453.1 MAG: damage-inducible protein CinA [Neptuniibacter sp. Phe_28]